MAVSLRAKQKHGAACAVIRRAELATSGGRRVLDPDISLIMGGGTGCSGMILAGVQDSCQAKHAGTILACVRDSTCAFFSYP